MSRRLFRKLVPFLFLQILWPTVVLAQEPKAGVVTTLQGAATLARPPLPQELPLKFKDDVLYRDRIATKEQSLVRVLLGGKALVTVRELSVFTVTEEPGRAVVEMQSGKIALAVARQLLRPGESVEVRTPNAIAAVRGTVMIVEVSEAVAPGAPGPAVPVTNVHCLSGVCRYGHRGSHVPEQDLPQGFTGAVQGPNVIPPTPSPPGVGQGYGATLQPSNEGQGQAAQQGQDQTAAVFGAPGAEPPPSTAPPNGTPSQGLQSTSTIGTNQNPGGGNGGGKGTTNLISNGGFETVTGEGPPWPIPGGAVPSWGPFIVSEGATAEVITNLGPIAPSSGAKMLKLVTSGSAEGLSEVIQTIAPGGPPNMLVGSFKYKGLTNESFSEGVPINDDNFTAGYFGIIGFAKTLSELNGSPGFVEADEATGFVLETPGFLDGSFIIVDAPGEGPVFFAAVDAGTDDDDDGECGPGCSDSAIVIDDVVVSLDPPLLEVTNGARYVSTRREPLFAFAKEARTFDSLLLVCCAKDRQPSSVELAGPLMRATNSNLTVPFFLVGVLPGGFLSSSTTDPLVLVEGGSSSLGSMIGVFDIQGASTAVDPTTGLTLGTDRSLRTGGELFRGDLGTTVTTNRLLKVDTALLEASAPILNLMAGSSMTSASDLVRVGPRANVIANVPSDALIKLNASTLTVNNGSLVSVAGGSVLSVTGNLVSLTNNSALNILNGSLVSISGGSVFRLTGGSLGAFGSGTNALSITNTAPLCTGCSLTTSIPNLGGYPVLLRNGAVASSVTVAPGFTPFAGLNGTNTVKVNGPSGAVLAVGGPTSKVILGP